MIDPGIIAALISGGITVSGGGIAWIRSRLKAKDTAKEKAETRLQSEIDRLQREMKLLEQAADLKDEAIADLKAQLNRLEITAELQERFFGQLPPRRRETGD
ncbi:hypothetical protein ACWEF6_02550 [Amycolatopsis sp. NPDC004772]